MTLPPLSNIEPRFGDMPDPRSGDNIRHPLINIMTITICAVICGADSWVDVEMFGQAKKRWLAEFLDLKHGIPSDDTLGRVFQMLDPGEFERRFAAWTQHICDLIPGEVVAMDGKQLRRSKEAVLGKDGIYMVNVWATKNGLSLAQKKVENQSNETTAVPLLLRLLELDGQVVTIDAIGCQTGIVETFINQNADYVVAVKGNQGILRDDVEAAFETAEAQQPVNQHRTVNKGHGRIEIRECWAVSDPAVIAYINDDKAWSGLQSLVKVSTQRHLLQTDRIQQETRYFISSLPADAQQLLGAVRAHWQIENSLHWVLDMAFREDESRVRKNHAPQNFAILRQVALNLLKQEDSLKVGIAAKRKRAGWDEAYLSKVLCAA